MCIDEANRNYICIIGGVSFNRKTVKINHIHQNHESVELISVQRTCVYIYLYCMYKWITIGDTRIKSGTRHYVIDINDHVFQVTRNWSMFAYSNVFATL